jgi:hypothetical protein
VARATRADVGANDRGEERGARPADVAEGHVERATQCVLDYLPRHRADDERIPGGIFLVSEARGEVVREALVVHRLAPSSPLSSLPPDPYPFSLPFFPERFLCTCIKGVIQGFWEVLSPL